MSIRRFLVACLIATAPVVYGQTTTIFSENFDELTVAENITSAGAFVAIGGTNIDVIDSSAFHYCVPPEFGKCLDMNGTGGNSQGIIQSTPIDLLPGVSYYLSFNLNGSQFPGVTTSTSVSFASYSQAFVLDALDDSSGTVVNQLVSVSAPTTAYLLFRSNTPGNIGALLDNVQITAAVAPIPEPSTYALMLAGLAAVGLTVRRRKDQSPEQAK